MKDKTGLELATGTGLIANHIVKVAARIEATDASPKMIAEAKRGLSLIHISDDTLKNILTVPISFKKLLTGKLIVCGVLSIIFGLICSLFTIIAEMIVGFPGFEISLALKAALQITAVNFFLYLAVLPIIALTCRRPGSFLVGVIIAFVYGYGAVSYTHLCDNQYIND